ncbi:MAG: hypothetical protein SOW44_06650 [Porphyromonas sp.]|nr:hypothetical protein [Porphyromonas sp.]
MYTINDILSSPQILSSVIDRANAVEQDTPMWRNYLTFQETTAKTFKTAYGSKSAVRMGSVISDYANKPLRSRESLTPGVLSVADLGDRFQIGKDRLELLSNLLARLNTDGLTTQSVTEISDFLVDDMRELPLAPEKRMDKILFDLITTGAAEIKLKDNPDGVQILDIEIPVNKEKAQSSDKGAILKFLQTLVTKYKRYRYREIVMSNETFIKYFVNSDEFKSYFKATMGNLEAKLNGILTEPMLNGLFTQLGLPSVRVISNYVRTIADEDIPLLPEGKVALIPSARLGYMRWKRTYETIDRVPTKTYVEREGGLLISTERTNEGRFTEYECMWVPEITEARSIVSIDLTAAI